MIFFCDNSGTIFKTVPEKIYQGSVNANTIYFVGAFDGDCVVTARFNLPNGLITSEQIMPSAYLALGDNIQTASGEKYGVWSLSLKYPVTELSGTVNVQFSVTNANENGVAATVCTASSTFDVERGVPVLQDDSAINYETLLTQIKAVLTALQQGDTENSIASAASAEAARISAENAAEAEQQALAAQESAQASAESAQASAESASQSETIVAGAVSQIQSYIKQTEQNTLNITNIQAVLQGNSQYALITLSQAYTSRVTANGANIFDNQLTPVESIKGNTVRCRNLFEYSRLGSRTNLTVNGDGTITIAANVYSVSTQLTLGYLAPKLKVGDVVTFNFKSDGCQFFGISGVPMIYLSSPTITITQAHLDGQLVFYGQHPSDEKWGQICTISNIQIEYGTVATDYQPYFTGLKNANINSIVSKNTQGETISTYQLSQAVELAEFDIISPPEQTLTRYTETIVFETTSDYWEMTSSGIFKYTGYLPETPDITQTGGFGVCNLFDPVSSQNPNGNWGIDVNGNFVVIKQDINSLEAFLSYLQTQETNGNPLMLSYKTAEPVSSVTFNAPQTYEVYQGGIETIVQGTTDNSEYGAKPTITQTYLGKVGE